MKRVTPWFLKFSQYNINYTVFICSVKFKIKCNMEPPPKATCSASSQITGALENKISYDSS